MASDSWASAIPSSILPLRNRPRVLSRPGLKSQATYGRPWPGLPRKSRMGRPPVARDFNPGRKSDEGAALPARRLPAGVDHHPAVGLLPLALGGQAVALDDLVLEAAEVVVLGGELDGVPLVQGLVDAVLDLAQRLLVAGQGLVGAEDRAEEILHLGDGVAAHHVEGDAPGVGVA